MGFMNLFKHFLGDDWGVHPDDHKRPAADKPVRIMPVPHKLYLPLQQHLGGPARPTVLVDSCPDVRDHHRRHRNHCTAPVRSDATGHHS